MKKANAPSEWPAPGYFMHPVLAWWPGYVPYITSLRHVCTSNTGPNSQRGGFDRNALGLPGAKAHVEQWRQRGSA